MIIPETLHIKYVQLAHQVFLELRYNLRMQGNEIRSAAVYV